MLGGVGVNQGSGNAGLVTAVDALTFDEDTYDLERVRDTDGDGTPDDVDAFPTDPTEDADTDGDGVGDNSDTNSRNDCKDGGWTRFTSPEFRNQGGCVAHHSSRR